MWTAASVLACALSVLGRTEASMPPIQLVEVAPPDVSAAAEAFVRSNTRTIYLITSSAVFQEATQVRPDVCAYSYAIRKLASVLAHEEWHVRHGPDEKSAYEHQLITLIRLGIGPGTGMFRSVQASMIKVLEARKRDRPDGMLARR